MSAEKVTVRGNIIIHVEPEATAQEVRIAAEESGHIVIGDPVRGEMAKEHTRWSVVSEGPSFIRFDGADLDANHVTLLAVAEGYTLIGVPIEDEPTHWRAQVE